jgi:hypothetical protein
MARVKTFRINASVNPEFGVPDKEMREWITSCEKELGIVTVNSLFVPAVGPADPRVILFVTKFDDAIPGSIGK